MRMQVIRISREDKRRAKDLLSYNKIISIIPGSAKLIFFLRKSV